MDTAVLASGSDSASGSRRPCLPRQVTGTSAHRGAQDLFTPRRLPYNPLEDGAVALDTGVVVAPHHHAHAYGCRGLAPTASVRMTAMTAGRSAWGATLLLAPPPRTHPARAPTDRGARRSAGCPPPTVRACPHDAGHGRRCSADWVPPWTVDETGQQEASP